MFKKLRSLKYVFKPSFWVMNYPYSPVLDGIIQDAIRENRIILKGRHYCQIGELKLWIENYPYASGSANNLRPSRLTIEQLHKHLCDLGWKSQKQEFEDQFRQQERNPERTNVIPMKRKGVLD